MAQSPARVVARHAATTVQRRDRMVALFHTAYGKRQLGCRAVTPRRILLQEHLEAETPVVTCTHQRHPVSTVTHQPTSGVANPSGAWSTSPYRQPQGFRQHEVLLRDALQGLA